MQNPNGGPHQGNANHQGQWNPTRQQLDQLESILQKMVKNPSSDGLMPQSHAQPTPKGPISHFAQSLPASNQLSHPISQNPFLKPPASLEHGFQVESVWNPSHSTWGPLADNWRTQQTTPLAQPIFNHPDWTNNPLPFPHQTSQTTHNSLNQPKATQISAVDDFGETGLTWGINALIDLPLRFLGPPGRYLITSGGRYFLGFLGFTFLTYSGILVASDWLELPIADSLIPSNFISNLIHKFG